MLKPELERPERQEIVKQADMFIRRAHFKEAAVNVGAGISVALVLAAILKLLGVG